MNGATFLLALRHRTCTVSPVRRPLAEARRFLNASREAGEGQARLKIIDALATGARDVVESDV